MELSHICLSAIINSYIKYYDCNDNNKVFLQKLFSHSKNIKNAHVSLYVYAYKYEYLRDLVDVNNIHTTLTRIMIKTNYKYLCDFIEFYIDYIDFNLLSIFDISECILRKYSSKFDMTLLSRIKKLPESIIIDEIDRVSIKDVCKFQNLSENFIRRFYDIVEWNYISKYQVLSEDFIESFKDKVNWKYISKYQNLSENFIRKFKRKVNWNYISSSDNSLSHDFIYEFRHKINWKNLSKCYKNIDKSFLLRFNKYIYFDYLYFNLDCHIYNNFTSQLDYTVPYENIIKSIDYLDIDMLIKRNNITKEILNDNSVRKYHHTIFKLLFLNKKLELCDIENSDYAIDYMFLSREYSLSEDFIENNIDKLYIYEIIRNQKLSVNFLRKHSNVFILNDILQYHKMPEDFIVDNIDYVDWRIVLKYQNISNSFIYNFKDIIPWKYVSLYYRIDKDFIYRYRYYINMYEVNFNEYFRDKSKYLEYITDITSQ